MKSNTRFNKNKKGLECLNCGYPLNGDENFCANCSQVNDERRINIKDYFSGFFANFFSFDSKLYKTLVPLLFKPGKISKEYVEGKRKKYANPFQLFLHITILYFILNALIGSIKNLSNYDADSEDTIVLVNNDTINASNRQTSKKDSLTNGIKKRLDSTFNSTAILKQFKNDSVSRKVKDSLFTNLYEIGINDAVIDLVGEKDVVQLGNIDNYSALHIFTSNYIQKIFNENEIDYDIKESYFEPIQNSIFSIGASDSTSTRLGQFHDFAKKHKEISARQALDSLGYKKNFSNTFWYQRTQDFDKLLNEKSFRKTYFNAVVSKISIALFFLLPIFALFFSLIYIRHPYKYTEHLVFVFNIQTVWFIFLIIEKILVTIIKIELVFLLLLLVFVFYIYKSFRNFYQQGGLKTILKAAISSVVYFILAFIGFLTISFLAFII